MCPHDYIVVFNRILVIVITKTKHSRLHQIITVLKRL